MKKQNNKQLKKKKVKNFVTDDLYLEALNVLPLFPFSSEKLMKNKTNFFSAFTFRASLLNKFIGDY
jgi:hypothetical protein